MININEKINKKINSHKNGDSYPLWFWTDSQLQQNNFCTLLIKLNPKSTAQHPNEVIL